MRKGASLRRRFSLLSLVMVGVLCLSSVFTMLIDTSKAAKGGSVSNKSFTLKDADINDYDNEAVLNSDVMLSSRKISADEKVTIMVELDNNSLGNNYNAYAKNKYESLHDYVTSDVGKGHVLNMQARQESLYNRLSKRFDMELRYSYSTFFNAFSAEVRYGDVQAIENDDMVYNLMISEVYEAPTPLAASGGDIAENLVKIDTNTGIYDTEDSGYYGKGTIVAILDTGLDYEHPAFQNLNGDIGGDEESGDGKYYQADIDAMLRNKSFAAAELSKGLSSNDVYLSKKIPYAYDYADKDSEVFPTNFHGTHVAGIIAGHDDVIRGAAPSAQIAIMKVFSDKEKGGVDADIWAALEDCVNLDVDIINMSLGSGSGFAREKDYSRANEVYDSVLEAGINLVCAAGNDFSSGFGSPYGLNLTSNPDSATVGSPSSYTAAISVASISGVKTPYMIAYDKIDKNGAPTNGLSIYYKNPSDNNGEELKFIDRLLGDKTRQEFEYVVVPGIGQSSDYVGLNVAGKIAVVKRGIDTFVSKIEVARAYGAIGVIVRNHVSGVISMSLGTEELIPSCSIKMDAGDELARRAEANNAAAQGRGGKIVLDKTYLAGPFMSDFSGWGPLPNLELKPEITAHGGDITSADIGGGYETTSGTSMAAPNFAGISALLRQHVIENYEEYGIEDQNDTNAIRTLVNQLFMSTATIAINEYSNPYSPRKQGAGLADLNKAIETTSYLFVKNKDGSMYDKTKLTLGDDPARTGVYELKFNIMNTASRSLTYNLETVIMTEGLSTDGKTVTEIPVLLTDASTSVKVSGGELSKNKKSVSVAKESSAEVTITIKLTKSEKKYLDETFKNGMYVEGFVKVIPTAVGPDERYTALNIPYLAFYGDWSDAPILDKPIYETSPDEVNDDLLEHEKNKADIKPVQPYGKASRTQGTGTADYYFPIGTQLYGADDRYNEIPVIEDHNALSLDDDGIYMLWGVGGFLRNAKTVKVRVINAYTGHVMLDRTEKDPYQNARKSSAFASGIVEFRDEIDIRTYLSEKGVGFVEGGKYIFELEAFLDWGDGKTYGNNNKFSFDFYVDSVAPEILDVNVRLEKDRYNENPKHYIDIDIYDTHYAAALDLQYYNPNFEKYVSVFNDGIMPLESTRGGVTRAVVDVTDVWEYIKIKGEGDEDQEEDYQVMVMLVDYAWNQSYQYMSIKDCYNAIEELEFTERLTTQGQTLRIFEEYDLRSELTVTASDNTRRAWDEDFVWESSDETRAVVKDGKVLTLKTTAGGEPVTITVSSATNSNVSASVDITVTEENYNPNVNKVNPKQLKMNHNALILATGTTYDLEVDIFPKAEALTDDWRVVWSVDTDYIYNPDRDIKKNDAGEPDPNGKTDYERSGRGWIEINPNPDYPDDTTKARIQIFGNYDKKIEGLMSPKVSATLQTRPQGSTDDAAFKDTIVNANCFITIPQTYVVEFFTLKSYSGNEAVVDIPGDLGIKIIGQYAFTSNNFITELTIPEGVRTIEGSAFAYCSNLVTVNLPASLINIGDYAFSGRAPKFEEGPSISSLTTVKISYYDADDVLHPAKTMTAGEIMPEGGTRKLRSIGERAFAQNEYLLSIDLSTVRTVGAMAFMMNNSLEKVDLSSTTTIGYGAFYQSLALNDIKFCEGVDIGDFAFFECEGLQTLEIPASRIGTLAFNRCVKTDENYAVIDGLDSVTFTGKGPLVIGDMAFVNCMGLRVIDFNDTIVTEIGDAAFAAARYVSNLTLPNGLTRIGEKAFELMTALLSIHIPADLDLIDLKADTLFRTCPDLAVVTVDEANPYIGAENNIIYAKDANGDLDKSHIVLAPSNADITTLDCAALGITKIAAYAFAGNDNITTVNLSGVTEVGDGAFSDCTYLTTVTYDESLVSLGKNAFEITIDRNNPSVAGIRNFNFVGNIADSKLTSIGEGAFRSTRVAAIVLPDTITEIAPYTFFNCASLQTVTASNITKIGDYAFTYSRMLSGIDLSKVTKIGEAAFMYNTRLGQSTAIQLSSVQTIGDYAFERCENLRISSLPKVKEIGDYAFGMCRYITTLELPEVTSIGKYAFSGYFVNPLYNPDNENALPPESIVNSENFFTALLESVNMPKIEFIGEGAFRYTQLTVVTLPNSLETVMPFAFANCAKLTAINVGDGNQNYFDDDGILYGFMEKQYALLNEQGIMDGYSANSLVLMAYPAARTAETRLVGEVTYKYYDVLEGTVKIEGGAFTNSTLQYVILPTQLNVIGHEAFHAAAQLKRIDFGSYYAPVLETVITSERITAWSYLPDVYSYNVFNVVTAHYANFVFALTTGGTKTVEITYPANGQEYTSYLYNQFFASATASNEHVLAPATESFINDINALPENLDWNRDNETVARLVTQRDLLTSVQRGFVSSAVLNKLASAKLWMENNVPVDTTPGNGPNALTIVLIIVAVVAVLAVAGVVAFIIIRKKKANSNIVG